MIRHRWRRLLWRVLYGNDPDALYMRVDARERCREALAGARVELSAHGPEGPVVVCLWPGDFGREPGCEGESACDDVLEAKIPLARLGVASLPARVRGHISLTTAEGDPLERFPGTGDLELELLSAVDSALNIGV